VPRTLVLASSSPARLRVLRDAGFDPEVVVSGVDESVTAPTTADLVLALATRKGEAVLDRCPGAVVVACDSLLDLDGQAAGKPGTAEAVAEQWRRMAGRSGVLCTGHLVVDTATGRRASGVAETVVRFGRPTRAEIEAYAATGEPQELAGACSLEGYGAPFLDGIDGDPSNVLGLSLPLFRRLLADIGVAITDLWRPSGAP
jgi:septum formation protein